MRNFLAAALGAALFSASAVAGALTLQVDDVRSNSEAMAKKAVVAAHITACRSPEKTSVSASAEGIVNGTRQTIPLRVIHLSEPGAFAVAHEWPREGVWTVKMIATNPDYKDYATAIVVPVRQDTASAQTAKVFYHAPSAEEINSVLKQVTLE
jgi:hypothetical protein